MLKITILTAMICATTWATNVTFQGKKVELNGSGLNIGDKAPLFMAVDENLKEIKVGGQNSKIQVIAFVPSLDTGVCKLETIEFNKKISKMKNVEVKIVSKDLPFAIGRFCHDNDIKNVVTLSDYKDQNNALRYGTTISSPVFLEGLFARVVYITDMSGKIIYKETVKEITTEPNYNKIIDVIKSIDK